MNTTKKPNAAEEADPVLAAALLERDAGGNNELLKGLLIELLEAQMEARKKEKDKAKRWAESAVQAAQELAAVKAARQAGCNHRKQDGTTRLAGQFIDEWVPDEKGHTQRRLALVCQFCHTSFFYPVKEGENPVPLGLFPPADEIGG